MKQQYNTVKDSHPFLSSTLQSNPNRLIQKIIQPAIAEQNQILDHKINHIISSNMNIPERPTFPLVKKVNSSNTLHTSTQTREKKQVTKQPGKIENNSMPLMGMFTNVKDVPRGELIISLMFSVLSFLLISDILMINTNKLDNKCLIAKILLSMHYSISYNFHVLMSNILQLYNSIFYDLTKLIFIIKQV